MTDDEPASISTIEPAPQRLLPRLEERRIAEIAMHELASMRRASLRIAAMSTGRGQAAEQIALQFNDAEVTLWYIDHFHLTRASEHIALPHEASTVGDASSHELRPPSNLNIVCMADLPAQEFDVAVLPLSVTGEQELARDLLQQMYHRLVLGGTLIVSVDNPKDKWVHEQLKLLERSVRVRQFDDAVVYLITKTSELKKLKDYSCELAFRDCDELIYLVTRPGVFSHRQLDNGARQLLDSVDVYPEANLLDIGCGSGSVTLGLAVRDKAATIHAVDSNSRALWCLAEGLKRNNLTNVTMELSSSGVYGEPARFDMALANPPYFGDFKIAEKFVLAAHRSLRPGGRLVLVTKQPKWYNENLPTWFSDCEVFPSRRYFIASGVK